MCIGLVDTEASYCSIPGGFAKDLGLDLESGKEDIIGTGNGKTKVYLQL